MPDGAAEAQTLTSVQAPTFSAAVGGCRQPYLLEIS